MEVLAPLRPGHAVDLGAGEGRNALGLARAGWRVTGVDSSTVALERLAAHAAAEGLTIEAVHGDLLEYLAAAAARGQRFDLVVLSYLHPPAAERAALLRAAAGAVAPGGYLFVVGHHRDSLGVVGPPDAERLYGEEDLAGVGVGTAFEVLRLERRVGPSDHDHPAGVDVLLWARAPGAPPGEAPSSRG